MRDLVTDGPVLQELEFRLSYGEGDPAGIVYYAAYYPWFERAMTEWSVRGDHTADRQRELWGATHVCVASGCRYRIPGRLFDPFTLQMRLGDLGRTSFTMHFSVIHRDNGNLYADGHMTFVYVDTEFPPKAVPVPQGLKDVIAAAGAWSLDETGSPDSGR